MKHKDDFKKWLPNNKVKSVDSYMAYAAKTEAILGMTIDKFLDAAIEKAIEERFTIENFGSKKRINDCRSLVRKYWK